MEPFFPEGRRSLRSRRGLPAKPFRTRRGITVKMRLTVPEHDELCSRATDAKLDMSSYVRQCSLHRPPRIVPSAGRAAAEQLARIGCNINQIARRLKER